MTTKDLKTLILWLRAERISYVTLTAGGITLDGVVDMKQEPVKQEPLEPAKPTMYQRFGGGLLQQPAAKKSESVPDEAMTDD